MFYILYYSRNFWSGVLTSLFAALLYNALSSLVNYSTSPFSGVWEATLYDNEKNILSEETYYLKHKRRTGELKGRIVASYPEERAESKSVFCGVTDDDCMLFVFSSPYSLERSHGSAYVVHSDNNIYEGYYIRKTSNAKFNINPIRIERIRNMGFTDYLHLFLS